VKLNALDLGAKLGREEVDIRAVEEGPGGRVVEGLESGVDVSKVTELRIVVGLVARGKEVRVGVIGLGTAGLAKPLELLRRGGCRSSGCDLEVLDGREGFGCNGSHGE
jgi:hypothetical protein